VFGRSTNHIKCLLCSRDSDPYLKDIYLSTHAIIFYGTPHRGSAYADLWGVLQAVANLAPNTNKRLLTELSLNSPVLQKLRIGFGKIINERPIEITSFQEGKGLSGFYGASKKVSHLTYTELWTLFLLP
jgi:hypothetical protein